LWPGADPSKAWNSAKSSTVKVTDHILCNYVFRQLRQPVFLVFVGSAWFLCTYSSSEPLGIRYLGIFMPFLSPNEHCQSTEWNSCYCSQRVKESPSGHVLFLDPLLDSRGKRRCRLMPVFHFPGFLPPFVVEQNHGDKCTCPCCHSTITNSVKVQKKMQSIDLSQWPDLILLHPPTDC